MLSKRKRIGIIIISLIITSFTTGYIIRGYSYDPNPTIDPTLGLYNFPWVNTSIGFNTHSLLIDGVDYTDEIKSYANYTTDHGEMTGLSDDDHNQYLFQDGSEEMAGDWDAGSHGINASWFEASEFYLNSEDKTDIFAYPEQDASYVIFKEGSTIYVKNGTTGHIDFSGTNAKTVIQTAIDMLPSGGKILVRKAQYVFSGGTQALLINASITLEAEPGTLFSITGTSSYGIKVIAERVSISGITMTYGSSNGYGIAGISQSRLYLYRVSVSGANTNEEGGLLLQDSWGNKIHQCSFTLHKNYGIRLLDTQTTTIIDTFSETNGINNLWIDASAHTRGENFVIGCYFEDSGTDAVRIETPYNVITDCSINDATRYAIFLQGDNADKNKIKYNEIRGAGTKSIIGDGGSTENKIIGNNVDNGISVTDCTVKYNTGYLTENSGTDTLTSGTTSKVVSHGCDYTPNAGDIYVNAIESLGSASFYWYDTITSTQFTIHVNVNPTQDVDFAWSVNSH